MTRAVVLGGGGVAGIAWLIGVASELAERGVDLAAADLLVGTSAGSAAAAQLATGQLAAAEAMQLSEQTTELRAEFDMPAFLAAMQEAVGDAPSQREASRRIANVPLTNTGADPVARRAAVVARLPVPHWPDGRLVLTAVDRETGERMTFDRAGGVDLVDAVTASCAVPGIWPPVAIDGREYVDGGVHSSTNADLAAGYDETLILVPSYVDEYLQERIARERATIGPSQLVVADADSVAAFGPNPLDPSTRAAAYRAGRAQAAATEIDWG